MGLRWQHLELNMWRGASQTFSDFLDYHFPLERDIRDSYTTSNNWEKDTFSTRSTWWFVRILMPSRDKVFSVYLHPRQLKKWGIEIGHKHYFRSDWSKLPRISGATSYTVILQRRASVGWCFVISACMRSCNSAANSIPVGPPPYGIHKRVIMRRKNKQSKCLFTHPQYRSWGDVDVPRQTEMVG